MTGQGKFDAYFCVFWLLLPIVTWNKEIWALKLWFLLIYENMLESIATVRSECTAKHKNKASYNTNYTVPNLIDFFGDNWKEIKTQIEKRNIHNCKKYCTTKNWFVVSNFWELSKHRKRKIMLWLSVFPTKNQS